MSIPVCEPLSILCLLGMTCTLSFHILQVFTPLREKALGGAPDPSCSKEHRAGGQPGARLVGVSEGGRWVGGQIRAVLSSLEAGSLSSLKQVKMG